MSVLSSSAFSLSSDRRSSLKGPIRLLNGRLVRLDIMPTVRCVVESHSFDVQPAEGGTVENMENGSQAAIQKFYA